MSDEGPRFGHPRTGFEGATFLCRHVAVYADETRGDLDLYWDAARRELVGVNAVGHTREGLSDAAGLLFTYGSGWGISGMWCAALPVMSARGLISKDRADTLLGLVNGDGEE